MHAATSPEAQVPVPGLAREWRGRGPFYEVWFGKADVAPGRAFWFRYTLLDGAVREAATWGLFFDAAARHVHAGRDVAALERVAGAVFELGDARLDGRRATGRAGELSWDLSIEDLGRRFEHVPALMRRTGLAKSDYSSCLLDVRLSGALRVGREEIRLERVRGMAGHIRGSRQAHGWAWAHCNSFEGLPDAVFEGLSARVAVGGRPSPPLSSFVVHLGGRRWEFRGLRPLLLSRSRWERGRWAFVARAGTAVLEGELSAPDPALVAVVRYTDTDGSHLWCHNSKLADLRLRLRDRGVDETLRSRGAAAFEVVERVPPPVAARLG